MRCREWVYVLVRVRLMGSHVLGGKGQVEDSAVRAYFDGRARVELPPGGLTAAQGRRADEIAYTLGYRLLDVQRLPGLRSQRVYERDDAPDACGRREVTIAGMRAGVHLPPGIAVPPPPPPGPPPPAPAPAQRRPRQPSRSPAEPPPPPGTVATGPRTPPPPPYPPYPPPPPARPATG